jgi:hypothetical protein
MYWIGWMAQAVLAGPSAPMLVIEVELGPVDQAWMLEMRSEGESVQVPCSDDGAPPDRAKNDDRPTCSGLAPGHVLELVLRNSQEEHTASVEWPETLDLLQARWREEGVVVAAWPLLPEASDELGLGPVPVEAQAAVADMLESAASDQEPVKTPEDPGGDDFWWAALALVGLAWVAWKIAGVGPVPHVERVETPGPRVRREPAAGAQAVIANASGHGTVLLALAGEVPLPETPGPVLKATSLDVSDLLDALSALVRRDSLAQVTLVTSAESLTHADGLGVPPAEALERGLPRGVRMVLLEEA